MNCHSPPTNASITAPGVANKYNNSTIMINSDDDNNISLFGKPKYTHDSKTTQQNSSNSIKNTNSRDLPKLLNPYTPNDKRLYNHHHMGSHENKAINKNDHYSSLQEGQIKYIRLNSLSKLSHNQKTVTASIILSLKDDISALDSAKELQYQREEIVKIISWLQSEFFSEQNPIY